MRRGRKQKKNMKRGAKYKLQNKQSMKKTKQNYSKRAVKVIEEQFLKCENCSEFLFTEDYINVCKFCTQPFCQSCSLIQGIRMIKEGDPFDDCAGIDHSLCKTEPKKYFEKFEENDYFVQLHPSCPGIISQFSKISYENFKEEIVKETHNSLANFYVEKNYNPYEPNQKFLNFLFNKINK